jgi:primosomal protein N' (replication factor Y)
MLGYAEVSVNSPVARLHSFSYTIPAGLNIAVGQAVWVPFGQKTLQGIVVSLSDKPAVEETREIEGIIGTNPLLSPAKVSLAFWISEYYLSPLFDAVALMLPPGFERRVLTFLKKTAKDYDIASLTSELQHVLDLSAQNTVNLKELEKLLGKRKAQTAVSKLVNRGLLERTYELEREKIKPKLVPFLQLLRPVSDVKEAVITLRAKRAIKQAELLEIIAETSRPLSVSEVRTRYNASSAVIDILKKKGWLGVHEVVTRREPVSNLQMEFAIPHELTVTQQSVLREIKSGLQQPANPPQVFLLHGVTGSGKTEIYLQALSETVRLGKKGIVLVPEISLTPQTIERFSARFPHRVAVLHSQLSLGEQFDEWQRIRDGECDVVIGPRSALFAPQPDLGLIVMDEEHEWTYKQDDKSPRYHARDVALKLAGLTGAAVILGSATPDVETYYRAEREFMILSLPQRVTPDEGSPLPAVEIVDMKQELMTGNRSIFSRPLAQAIDEEVANRHQVLLFLNRRGGATFVQCRKCGYVIRCKRCDVSLTYHTDENQLVCHQCNYHTPVPLVCPRCSSRSIKFVGIGTQKVEQEAGLAFPFARLMRWDSDVIREGVTHERILNDFRDHKADILIGTQIIAKGHDLPLVTLVGVINADTSLNLPDFRANERTFQLLSQVAGRAGRGISGGRVVIQTYSPENYAIQAAARHDYTLFYNQEMAYRLQLNDPPFSHLVRLVFTHSNEIRCREEAGKMARTITLERDAAGIAGLSVIGPAPSYIPRVRGRFHWQLVLRGHDPSLVLSRITIPQGWTVDVDPVGI